MHSVGSVICRENGKSQKMRNKHFRSENMARKTENVENLEMSPVGKKTENHGND